MTDDADVGGMSLAEVKDWLLCLPFHTGDQMVWRPCRNNLERLKVVRELLHYADKDQMSEPDRRVCRRALRMLQETAVEKKEGSV